MKRREFLAFYSGVAGLVLPDWAQAQTTPADRLGPAAATDRTTVAGRGREPAWFARMPRGSWAAIGSNTLASVQFKPLVVNPTYSAVRPSGVLAYSGATTDEARRELLICGNGGHSDYLGNEGYAFALWADAPYWYRLNDPTPAKFIYDATTNANIVDGTSRFLDGRCTSMHTYGIQTYANGRVWYQFQGHQTGGAGSWIHGVCAYRRDAFRYGSEPGQETTGAVPHPGISDPGPWEFYGAVNHTPHTVPSAASNAFSGCHSLLDPRTGSIWSIAPRSPGLYYTRLDSATGEHRCFDQGRLGGGLPEYAGVRLAPCLIPDRSLRGGAPGVILMLQKDRPEILLLSVPRMGRASSAPAWSLRTPGGDRPPLKLEGGASVYHDGAVYYMNWTEHGSRIYRLTLPADPDDSNWSDAWTVISAEDAINAPATGIFPNDKPHTKFRMIRDMGEGHAALVCLDDHAGPVKVYKL